MAVADFAPATAGGNLAHLFEFDMHEITGAVGGDATDHAPSRAVQPTQMDQAVEGQKHIPEVDEVRIRTRAMRAGPGWRKP